MMLFFMSRFPHEEKMKTSRLVAIVVAALPVLALTQHAIASAATAYNPPEKPVTEIIKAKTEQSWKDWQQKNEKAYSSILAEGYMAVLPDGQGPHDKVATLPIMHSMTINSYTLSNFKFTSLGPTAGLATYKADLDMVMGPQSGRVGLAVAEVWVKREGDWKLLHYQETEVK
jgi:hypothetical protein